MPGSVFYCIGAALRYVIETGDTMSHNFPLDHHPLGVSKKTGNTIKNVHNFFQGDSIFICTTAFLIDDETAATPENSDVTFTLVDDRFRRCVIYEGTWKDGVEKINEVGGIRASLPREISENLRRGKFIYSITVTDKLGVKDRHTHEEGYIQIEYSAMAPNPDVAYRNAADEFQNDAATDPNTGTPN